MRRVFGYCSAGVWGFVYIYFMSIVHLQLEKGNDKNLAIFPISRIIQHTKKNYYLSEAPKKFSD